MWINSKNKNNKNIIKQNKKRQQGQRWQKQRRQRYRQRSSSCCSNNGAWRAVCAFQVMLWSAYQCWQSYNYLGVLVVVPPTGQQPTNTFFSNETTSTSSSTLATSTAASETDASSFPSQHNTTTTTNNNNNNNNKRNQTQAIDIITNTSSTSMTARRTALPASMSGRIDTTDLASVMQYVLQKEWETFQWEQRTKQLDRYATQWAHRAAKLRRRFQRDIHQITLTPSNQQKTALAFDVLHDDGDDNTTTQYNNSSNVATTIADPFANILVAVDLPDSFMKRPDPTKFAANIKAVVGYEQLLTKLPPATCTVYGAGLDYQSAFEKRLAARTQCAIHTFDCTLTAPDKLYRFLTHQFKTLQADQVYWYKRWHNQDQTPQRRTTYRPNLAYHPWCLGDPNLLQCTTTKQNETNTAAGKQYDAAAVDTTNTFTLDTILQRLGHATRTSSNATNLSSSASAIDLLKFDIEGYEWQLFDMLLDSTLTDPATLPQQMSFELHTQGARRKYVPTHTVQGKDAYAVARLFQELWKLGYRVVYKEMNGGDPACAEFVIYRFAL